MLRTGTRGNEARVSLHYMPNCTRVIVPPMAGLDGTGGWRELSERVALTPRVSSTPGSLFGYGQDRLLSHIGFLRKIRRTRVII